MIGPGDDEAAVRRAQWTHGDAARGEDLGPASVRAEPGPARTAQRQERHVGPRNDRGGAGCREAQLAGVTPSGPAVAQGEADTRALETRAPSPQQRRGLHRPREDAAAR